MVLWRWSAVAATATLAVDVWFFQNGGWVLWSFNGSIASYECLFGLEFVRFGRPLSTLGSFSCSLRHFWMVFVVWWSTFSCLDDPDIGSGIDMWGCPCSAMMFKMVVHVKISSTQMQGPKISKQNYALYWHDHCYTLQFSAVLLFWLIHCMWFSWVFDSGNFS